MCWIDWTNSGYSVGGFFADFHNLGVLFSFLNIVGLEKHISFVAHEVV